MLYVIKQERNYLVLPSYSWWKSLKLSMVYEKQGNALFHFQYPSHCHCCSDHYSIWLCLAYFSSNNCLCFPLVLFLSITVYFMAYQHPYLQSKTSLLLHDYSICSNVYSPCHSKRLFSVFHIPLILLAFYILKYAYNKWDAEY